MATIENEVDQLLQSRLIRIDAVPTDDPVPTAITITQNVSTENILLEWSYTPGFRPAEEFHIYWTMNKTAMPSAPVLGGAGTMGPVIVPADQRNYLFRDVAPDWNYVGGIVAVRNFRGTKEYGNLVTPTSSPDWRVPKVVNTVATLVNNSTALIDSVTPGAPTNQVTPGTFTIEDHGAYNRRVIITWTYTQGTIPATDIGILWTEGTSAPAAPTLSAYTGYRTAKPESGYYMFENVPPDLYYKVGICAGRQVGGVWQTTALITPVSWVVTPNTYYRTALVPLSIVGKPKAGLVFYWPSWTKSTTIKAGLPNAQFVCAIAPTGSVAVTIKNQAGTTLGTITWAAGSTTATVSFASDVVQSAGQYLSFTFPATQDANFSDPRFNIEVLY